MGKVAHIPSRPPAALGFGGTRKSKTCISGQGEQEHVFMYLNRRCNFRIMHGYTFIAMKLAPVSNTCQMGTQMRDPFGNGSTSAHQPSKSSDSSFTFGAVIVNVNKRSVSADSRQTIYLV